MANTITQTSITSPNETETSWVKASKGVMIFAIAIINYVFGSGT